MSEGDSWNLYFGSHVHEGYYSRESGRPYARRHPVSAVFHSVLCVPELRALDEESFRRATSTMEPIAFISEDERVSP